MTTLTLRFVFVFITMSTFLIAQTEQGLQLTFRQLPDHHWGVFVKPGQDLFPSKNTLAGTGQVTLVAPSGFSYLYFQNHAGTWVENARVSNPLESLGKTYISFGFASDYPKINLYSNEETLLFTFISDPKYDGYVYLIDNELDPFNAPNSRSSNPGNELTVADKGFKNSIQFYQYMGNYGEQNTTKSIFAGKKEKKKNASKEEMVLQWLEEEEEN